MGTSSSKDSEKQGSQLYVSLKMENLKIVDDLIPHVYGSSPVIGSWDSSKSLPMVKDSPSMWELSFVIPSNHETLDFKFLLKPKYGNTPCVVEEGPSRLLIGGSLEGNVKTAIFRPYGNDEVVVECRVFMKADIISPFDLATSWRAYQENLQPSTVRGIPDVSINAGPDGGHENGSSASLELDLEHYLVPSPNCGSSSVIYAANLTETPRWLGSTGVFSKTDASNSASHGSTNTIVGSVDHASSKKDIEDTVQDPSKVTPVPGMVESKSVGTFSPLQMQDGQRGLFVDRGVGSPRLVKSASANSFTNDLKYESEAKKGMPAAAGAVAAAAIADQMLGQKEDSHLAIVLQEAKLLPQRSLQDTLGGLVMIPNISMLESIVG